MRGPALAVRMCRSQPPQTFLVEKPEVEAFLGRMVLGEPVVGYGAQLRKQGLDLCGRNDAESHSLRFPFASGLAQLFPIAAVHRKVLERHAGLFQLTLTKNGSRRPLFNEPWSEAGGTPFAEVSRESAA